MTYSDTQRSRRLDAGEILIAKELVSGSPLPRVVVEAVFEASPERVWSVIDRVRDYTRTMTSIKRSDELVREARDDGSVLVRARITIGMPFPLKDLTSVTDAIHTAIPGERYERAWTFVEGDYRDNSGAWILIPFEKDPRRTLVVYRLHAVPKIRVPASIHGLAQKKVIPKLINNLRASVKKV